MAFNAQFEAFNKQIMYGTDIITIVNKAIQNNKNKEASSKENIGYINIKIKTNNTFETIIKAEGVDNKTYTGKDAEKEAGDLNITNISGKVLEGGKTYELGNWEEDKLNPNNDIIDFFQSDTEDLVKSTIIKQEQQVYYIYSALTTFKTSRFKCTEVSYNDEGIVKEMSFEQI